VALREVVRTGGSAASSAAAFFRPFSIQAFYERLFLRYALRDPELLTSVGILESLGSHFHNARLTDVSERRLQANAAFLRRALAKLRRYGPASQSESERLSAAILDWFLDDAVRGEQFRYHEFPVNQFTGVQNELPALMATAQPLANARDARNYVARLSRYGVKFGQVLEGLRIRESKRLLPPRFVIERVLEQMRAFIADPPERNLLYTALARKHPDAAILQAARDEIRWKVYPAYAKLIDYLAALAPAAGEDDGAWRLPGGGEYYAWALRHHTTASLSPEAVHQIGLEEVARIECEMARILDALGVPAGSLGDRLRTLEHDARFAYPDTAEGRARVIAGYKEILEEAARAVAPLFDLHPKAALEVERMPAFKECGSPGAYYQPPSFDGSRPGVFFVNLRSPAPKWAMRTLAYHEGIPGHHFQIALAQQMRGVPTFRRFVPFTAYIEGWALYAERLAFEAGLERDPHDNLGRLADELLRAMRLVVDTGIHWKRWTREQAIEYMQARSSSPAVPAEVERYIVAPGQACAYKIGEMKILELRERAKRELGEAFDIRRFHNSILANGAMPLEILEQCSARTPACRAGACARKSADTAR
jgi:uncharacterized protein (DUF885 family)